MTLIQMMFLACWAVLDLALVIFSPTRKYLVAIQGLSKRSVKERWQQPEYAAKGCNLVAGNLLELLVMLVVEPAYLLWALCAHIGLPLVALGMGGILLANVVNASLYGWRERKQDTYPVLTPARWVWMWFCTIPTLYPWYVLLVVCGLVH